jgi:chromosome segregation ATPase
MMSENTWSVTTLGQQLQAKQKEQWEDVQQNILALRQVNKVLTCSNAELIARIATTQAAIVVRDETLTVLSARLRQVTADRRDLETKLSNLVPVMKDLLCEVLSNMEPYVEEMPAKGEDPLPFAKYTNTLNREQYKRILAMFVTLCMY